MDLVADRYQHSQLHKAAPATVGPSSRAGREGQRLELQVKLPADARDFSALVIALDAIVLQALQRIFVLWRFLHATWWLERQQERHPLHVCRA